MRNVLQFSLMIIVPVLLLSGPHMLESGEENKIQVRLPPPQKSFVIASEERFIDNGDGTITDVRRKINDTVCDIHKEKSDKWVPIRQEQPIGALYGKVCR